MSVCLGNASVHSSTLRKASKHPGSDYYVSRRLCGEGWSAIFLYSTACRRAHRPDVDIMWRTQVCSFSVGRSQDRRLEEIATLEPEDTNDSQV